YFGHEESRPEGVRRRRRDGPRPLALYRVGHDPARARGEDGLPGSDGPHVGLAVHEDGRPAHLHAPAVRAGDGRGRERATVIERPHADGGFLSWVSWHRFWRA